MNMVNFIYNFFIVILKLFVVYLGEIVMIVNYYFVVYDSLICIKNNLYYFFKKWLKEKNVCI